MRLKFTLFLTLICSLNCFGQLLDDILNKQLASTFNSKSAIYQNEYVDLLDKWQDLKHRLKVDTMTYDYLYVEQKINFRDATAIIHEWYYDADSDSSKNYSEYKLTFSNDSSRWHFYLHTLENMDTTITKNEANNYFRGAKKCKSMKYAREQVMLVGCISFKDDKQRFIKKRKQQIKSTYQMFAVVNESPKMIESFVQIPQQRIRFKVEMKSMMRF